MFAAPGEFVLPRFVEGGWQIGEWRYAENPRFTVPAWMTRLVERWAELRSMSAGPLGPGGSVLPFGGGYYDQVAWVIDAFQLFDRWSAERKQAREG